MCEKKTEKWAKEKMQKLENTRTQKEREIGKCYHTPQTPKECKTVFRQKTNEGGGEMEYVEHGESGRTWELEKMENVKFLELETIGKCPQISTHTRKKHCLLRQGVHPCLQHVI